MKTELERTKLALKVARETMEDLACHYVDVIQKDRLRIERDAVIDALLNPPPEMETVEVVRWECAHCHDISMAVDGDEDPPNGNYCCNHHMGHIKLTGIYQPPKPQKVERSVSVEAYITPDGEVKLATKDGYVNYPTFKAHEEVCHKTVTITATWTE